jgi:hypothetical protein
MVYVDEGIIAFSGKRVHWMMADTEDELHAMAAELHVKHKVFSKDRTRYYEILAPDARRAMMLGVVLVERSFLLDLVRLQSHRFTDGSVS